MTGGPKVRLWDVWAFGRCCKVSWGGDHQQRWHWVTLKTMSLYYYCTVFDLAKILMHLVERTGQLTPNIDCLSHKQLEMYGFITVTLYNERGGISIHWHLDCLLKRLFRCRSKKTSELCVDGLCAGNSPFTGEFPAQKASNREKVSIWRCHHVMLSTVGTDALVL